MRRHLNLRRAAAAGIALCPLWVTVQLVCAQGKSVGASVSASAHADGAEASVPPADYVIGPEDQLAVVFFQNKDASTDVIVRPDGKISLPLLNEIQASGLTPEQLRGRINEQAKRFFQDPSPTIVVRQINSRKVFITGWVEKPGTYPLLGATTVLQLIATAGGLKEDADAKKILIIRGQGGPRVTYRFNYKEVTNQKNMDQDIELKPGDTVVVP
jgi:polysaccharide export outer membrane protein